MNDLRQAEPPIQASASPGRPWDPEAANRRFAASNRPLDMWFKDRLKELFRLKSTSAGRCLLLSRSGATRPSQRPPETLQPGQLTAASACLPAGHILSRQVGRQEPLLVRWSRARICERCPRFRRVGASRHDSVRTRLGLTMPVRPDERTVSATSRRVVVPRSVWSPVLRATARCGRAHRSHVWWAGRWNS